MRDLGKIERGMSRATRGLIWADVGLSGAFVLVLAFGSYVVVGDRAAAGDRAEVEIVAAESVQVTLADVEKETTGKVLFRTSATSLKEKIVDELAHFELKGISTRGGKKLAHVKDNKLKKLVTKRVGESLGAYEIVDITNEGVTVRRGTETVVLSKG